MTETEKMTKVERKAQKVKQVIIPGSELTLVAVECTMTAHQLS